MWNRRKQRAPDRRLTLRISLPRTPTLHSPRQREGESAAPIPKADTRGFPRFHEGSASGGASVPLDRGEGRSSNMLLATGPAEVIQSAQVAESDGFD